jgi:hypothetical protein
VQQVWHAAVTDRVAFLEPAIFEQLVQLRCQRRALRSQPTGGGQLRRAAPRAAGAGSLRAPTVSPHRPHWKGSGTRPVVRSAGHAARPTPHRPAPKGSAEGAVASLDTLGISTITHATCARCAQPRLLALGESGWARRVARVRGWVGCLPHAHRAIVAGAQQVLAARRKLDDADRPLNRWIAPLT